MKIASIILPLVILLSACQKQTNDPQNGPMENWSWIASVAGNDQILHNHLIALLDMHGIESFLMGSVVYGIAVPNDKINKAIQLIDSDRKALKYGITIHTNGKSEEHPPPKVEWREISPDKHYLEWMPNDNSGPSAHISALIQSRKLHSDAAEYPYIKTIKYIERPYLTTNNTINTGYVFSVEFLNSREKYGSRQYRSYQVWDNGRIIE